MGYNSENFRSFLAFDIPEDIVADVCDIQKQIGEQGLKIKWVASQNLHLTVKFLGSVSSEKIEQVKAAAPDAAREAAPLKVAVRGVGVFPDMKRPQVVWVGLTGDTRPLIDFHDVLDEHLEQAGFEKDERRFNAHITMGRIKSKVNTTRLAEAMGQFLEFESRAFGMDKLVLYKSDLQPTGPVYTQIDVFPLGGSKPMDNK